MEVAIDMMEWEQSQHNTAKKKTTPTFISQDALKAVQYLETVMSAIVLIRIDGSNIGLSGGDRVAISNAFATIKREMAGI